MKLTVAELGFAYKQAVVLKGVNLTATTGECVCVLGANGAGKTTLFRCLLGLLEGYSGQISFNDQDGAHLSARSRAKLIAYVPQAHSPVFNYSVFDTVLMGRNVAAGPVLGPGPSQDQPVRDALEDVGIAQLAERGFGELSGGERQLVLVARALAQQAEMIVMDEPTANLDYGNQLRVLDRVRALARRGHLVLLSTHSPEHALLFADRVIVLKDGLVAADGVPGDVLTASLIDQIYGVSVEVRTVTAAWGEVPVIVPRVSDSRSAIGRC